MTDAPATLSHLPLPPGGRPAMGAREWLERLHLHQQAALPGWGLPALAGMSAAWSLLAAAQALRQSSLEPHQTLKGWEDLPVLVSPGFARHWEIGRPWMGWGLQTYQTTSYQALLDGPKPSSAYIPSSNDAAEVWRAYMAHEPLEDICRMLENSANMWLDWAQRRPQGDRFITACRSIQTLAVAAGLDGRQAQLWSMLELWWLGMAEHTPVFGQHLMELFSARADQWFAVCAAAVNATPDEVSDLFSVSGRLVSIGLYNPLVRQDNVLGLPGVDRSLSARMQSWSTPGWNLARPTLSTTGMLSWGNLAKHQPRTQPSDPGLMAADWSHTGGDFERTVAALGAQPALRILVVGDPGTGKTKLAHDLLGACGKDVLSLNPIKDIHVLGNRDQLMSSLDCASWACVSQDHAALLIDGHEGLFEGHDSAKFLRDRRGHPIVVVVENLKRIHSSVRESFDKIIWLEAMPLAQRLSLAARHFHDDILALRVARALRTPRAIMDAASWCRMSESWTWSTVQSHSRNAERAAANTGFDNKTPLFEIEVPVTMESLPPMAGNTHLVELANRLALSFENPHAFSQMGATPPRGAILLGPPGTGKTLFARHLAARLQAPMIAPDPSALAKHPDRVSLLFEFARRHAPCVVLLDEAEPLICLRPFSPPPEALAALLTEIDGVEQLEGVMVIATTNNSMIAPPLLRSGRLSEVRSLDVPFQEDREHIWEAYLKGRPLEPTSISEPLNIALARASRGLTGADIADTLRRAAGEAVAAGEKTLSLARLLRACDDVRWAAADGRDSACPQERRSVAIHEAGHALLAWRWGLEVQRITVRSRMGALGMVQWDHIERRHEQTRSKAFGRLQMALGGIAAEQALLGEHGSGGSADLAYANDLLVQALAYHGLGGLGPVSAGQRAHWSDELRRHVEMEIQVWSRAAFSEAVSWLSTHHVLVNELADCLLAAGDLSGPELEVHAAAVAAISETLPLPPRAVLFKDSPPSEPVLALSLEPAGNQEQAVAGRRLHNKQK